MDYNTKQVLRLNDVEGKRILRKRYAIRIEFEQGGRLGEKVTTLAVIGK